MGGGDKERDKVYSHAHTENRNKQDSRPTRPFARLQGELKYTTAQRPLSLG